VGILELIKYWRSTFYEGRQESQRRERERRKERPGPVGRSYLIRVHFEFADDFDGDLAWLLGIFGTIDIAESTISHLLLENISF
jgi:hypothetical protein